VAQLVARGVWDAEVASSSLVAPTNQGGEIKKSMLFFIEPTQIGMFFTKAEKHTILKKTTWWSFFMLTIICELAERPKGWIYFIDALE
jgi:hypothetical protein